MEFKYIIIEDNPGAVLNLQTAMKDFQSFKEVGFAYNPKTGIALIREKNPHLIFLDVELGDENGFDVLKEIRHFNSGFPFFIMITDYEKYAIEAVNKDAVYFLEKPIDPDELALALQKVEKQFLILKKQIIIKNTEGHQFLNLCDIHYIEADNNACKIYNKDKTSLFVTKTLKEIENILPPEFIRIHKSYIINKSLVRMINTTKKILLLETDDGLKEFPIGNLYLEEVRNSLLLI